VAHQDGAEPGPDAGPAELVHGVGHLTADAGGDDFAVHDGGRHGRLFCPDSAQCRKWRSEVRTMAVPRSSAAATTSASRTEPPGWTTTATPAEARTSSPSRKGKKASLAATAPTTASPALPT